ncbi:S1 family peptidase [Photobacterium leiognathi]|uniref:Serine protease n=1 Tax=Photobacterium leiognathi subsp. mandapamensis TaxID=48408 RepID=A0A2T3KS83_PHOLD|nr:serine protease [Photobacterium leiognathi]PSV09212.1 serine protease [Photobacterium leiognathi subsp. mandapamensis]
MVNKFTHSLSVCIALGLAGSAYAQAPTPFIIGGSEVTVATEDNFMASLRWNKKNETQFCGATVLDDRWLLTAAHCVVDGGGTGESGLTVIAPSDITVTTGLVDNPSAEIKDIYSATHVVVHPDYNPLIIIEVSTSNGVNLETEILNTALDNDVALIRVNRDFNGVGKVKLASTSAAVELDDKLRSQWNDKNLPENVKVQGWGSTTTDGSSESASSILLETKLASFPIDKCYERFESQDPEGIFIDSPSNTTKLCTLPARKLEDLGLVGPDTCKGDSGGPLLTQDNDSNWVQIGIVSGGSAGEPQCGSLTRPTFYARVGTYYEWITESVKTVPESAITLPAFLEKEKEQAEQGCNDSISANNCNIGKNDSGGGYIGGLMLTLLGSMAWIRRKRH